MFSHGKGALLLALNNYIKDRINLIRDPNKKDTYKLKEILREFYKNILRFFFLIYPSSGINVVDKEWKYLIILDACRYDYFKKHNTLKGKLRAVKSSGSCTQEWVKNNFAKDCKDIVVVAGNPHYSKVVLKRLFGYNPFFYLENVWDYGWDSNLKTVHPSKVTEAAVKLINNFPEKRFIIHYNQPHHPFIKNKKFILGEFNPELFLKGGGRSGETVWKKLKRGKVDLREVKRGYEDNLKLVLKEVRNLIPFLEGKIVVTSDHGNCFGEYGLFSHPYGIHIKELIQVPWFTINKNKLEKRKRRPCTNGYKFVTNEKENIEEDEKIKKRLKDLGYI